MVSWWIGTRKGLFGLDADGRVALLRFEGVPVTMVCPHGEDLWVALEHGHYGPKLHRSRDRGVHFEELPAPAFPAGEPGEPSVSTIWSLERGGDGRLWLGTIPGGLFRSEDEGATWVLDRTLWDCEERAAWFGGGADQPGIHSSCIHPSDPDDVIVGVSCGGVWRTRDGGASWALCAEGMEAAYMPPSRARDPRIQDPHRIVRCRAAPEVLFCQHHNAAYRSVDGAASWSRLAVPPSDFGFAVAVHPHDPDTAWFVPAVSDDVRIPVDGAVVVTRTRDGGQHFDVLREGLPGKHAYDLVFRHALDVDEDGERIVLGSTTGSVWLGRGERFQTLHHHLPPVYCTRYAGGR